eukprot:TRINITY_DN3601_c0_g1_i4.p1 TRINITY_DN3601_c0_g1~~TRINITY_DN3601_c0_g1_i4.p1  ORF type:complete len:186 (-),score=29.17 TRINITY_DN3601_c0_g1_i4:92-649(-)
MKAEQERRQLLKVKSQQNIKPFGSTSDLTYREPLFTNLAPGTYNPKYNLIAKYINSKNSRKVSIPRFTEARRFHVSATRSEYTRAPITQKVLPPSHIPCISFRQQIERPQTTKTLYPSQGEFVTNPFPKHSSKYPKVKNLVNMKMQSPRKELAAPGFPLEYEPHYDLVFPRVMSAKMETRSKVSH